MPTNRRHRLKRRHGTALTEPQVSYLLTGQDMFFAGEEIDAADVWPKVRETLLPLWIAHHPGRRPWAWWEFDAPSEPRQRIHDDGPPGLPEKGLRFGFPIGFAGYWPGVDMGELYEPEADYLSRFGLLEPGELERCAGLPFITAGAHTKEFLAEVVEACGGIDLN